MGLPEFLEVGEEIEGLTDGEAEEVSGRSADRFGIVGRGTFAEEDAGATEGGGVADDGAEVAGVGDLGEDDEGAFFESGEGWVFWLAGDGEVAAVEVEAEEGGGLGAGEVLADGEFFFDVVVGFFEARNGDLAFDDEVGGGFALLKEGVPVLHRCFIKE